jgi:cytochrome c biogenesis protein
MTVGLTPGQSPLKPSDLSEEDRAASSGGRSEDIRTTGIELRQGAGWLKEAVELMSSMRFAISALSVLCIASAIGTIVPQNSPPINYVNQFGAFWAEAFSAFDVFRVYNAGWFMVFMALMLVSTSLCLIRNTPKMLRDARSWRMAVREQAYQAFRHRTEFAVSSPTEAQSRLEQVASALRDKGFSVKVPPADADRPALVAKKGSTNRLGYIAAHLSIVVISLGGLLDSELPMRASAWWWEKTPVQLTSLDESDLVPDTARLPQTTPSYRANLLVPEGLSADIAVLSHPDGSLLLDLPFELALKAFRVEYYNTGMPKLFASDVVLTDKATGQVREETIEVNKPLIHRGIAIYQSSFDDGGSKLSLSAHPLQGPLTKVLPLDLAVGQSIQLRSGEQTITLEVSGFKPINVESLGDGAGPAEGFQRHVASVVSPAANTEKEKKLQNVGPSFNYKIRDAAGQAKEFHNYMLPVELEGARVYLSGVRSSPDESFRYLRIPADQNDGLDEFLRIRAALARPELRAQAAEAFARSSAPPAMVPALSQSAQRALDAIAEGGLQNLADILEQTVPPAERDKAADVIVRLLTGAFWEAWQIARQADRLGRLERTDENLEFTQRALNAFSDSLLYDAPILVSLNDYEHIQASVFQVTRSPGKTTVYLGCLLLVLGIFAMLYIPERRVWVWISRDDNGVPRAVRVSASTPRPSLDFDREFEELKIAAGR